MEAPPPPLQQQPSLRTSLSEDRPADPMPGAGSGASGPLAGAGASASSSSASSSSSSSSSWRQVVPPFRFAAVEHGLYRGACPTVRNLPFLRTLRLRTVVSLLPERPPAELARWCERQAVRLVHFNVAKFKGEVTLPPHLVAEILELLLDPQHAPVYLHCLDGGNNTGMVVACLRKLQHWSGAVVGAEFSRFVRPKHGLISSAELEFLDSFRAPVRLPPLLPRWLWHGALVDRHSTLPLVSPAAPVASSSSSSSLAPASGPPVGPSPSPAPRPGAEEAAGRGGGQGAGGAMKKVLSFPEVATLALAALDMEGFRPRREQRFELDDFRLASASAPPSAPPTPAPLHRPPPDPQALAQAQAPPVPHASPPPAGPRRMP